jgi:hypothetical protein
MNVKRFSAGAASLLVVAGSLLTLARTGGATGHARVFFHPNVLYFAVDKSSSATTTLTNAGTATVYISSFALTGSLPDFSITASSCSLSLDAGQSCTVTLSGTATKKGLVAEMVEGDSSGKHEVAVVGQ